MNTEKQEKINTFQKMEAEKVEPKEEQKFEEEQEVGLDLFNQQEFLSSPEPGESIEFTVDKIVKNPNVEGTNKTTGEKFDIGVKKKNGEVIRYDIITKDNKRFTLNSWGLVYLFIGNNSEFAAKVKELKTYSGIKVRLTRNYDGSVPNKKTSDVMKLYGLKTVEEAEAYKKEVAKALKEGKLYTLEIL